MQIYSGILRSRELLRGRIKLSLSLFQSLGDYDLKICLHTANDALSKTSVDTLVVFSGTRI